MKSLDYMLWMYPLPRVINVLHLRNNMTITQLGKVTGCCLLSSFLFNFASTFSTFPSESAMARLLLLQNNQPAFCLRFPQTMCEMQSSFSNFPNLICCNIACCCAYVRGKKSALNKPPPPRPCVCSSSSLPLCSPRNCFLFSSLAAEPPLPKISCQRNARGLENFSNQEIYTLFP